MHTMNFTHKFLFFLAIGIQLFLAVASLQYKGLTYDESKNYRFGLSVLQGHPVRGGTGGATTMPVQAINALTFSDHSSWEFQVKISRYITICFLLVLSILVFCWTRELFGIKPAILSLFLFCLDPNFIAHGQLVTMDVYAALAMTSSLYFYWKFLKYGGYKYMFISAIVLGLSQLVKYSFLSLYFILVVMAFVRFYPVITKSIRQRDSFVLRRLLKSFLKNASFFFLVSLLVINIGFCFHKSFMPLKDLRLKSQYFKLLENVPILRDIRLPLPHPFLQGVDSYKYAQETGDSFGNTYLLGDLREGGDKGIVGYFFVATLFKTPLGTLILFLIAFAVYISRRCYQHRFAVNEAFLLMPFFILFLFCNFVTSFCNYVGFRYVLFLFPLLYIFCGSLFVFWDRFSNLLKGAVITLIIYTAASVFSYFPHYISYFNELVLDRKKSYKILADSNIDWGGNEWFLREYIKKHPDSIFSPSKPMPGRIIVTVNNLVGVFNPERYQWLRENFEPVDHIAYSYLVYEVSAEDLKKKNILIP